MKCRVCSNEAGNTAHTFREMMFGFRDEFEYVECASCQCIQIVNIPESLSKYYPSDYHSFAQIDPPVGLKKFLVIQRDKYAASGRGVVGRLLSRYFAPVAALKSLAPLELKQTDRILDVGCGAGLLLDQLGRLGFRHLVGIDPFLTADVERPNGVKLLKRTIHEVAGEFDAIMLHHTLEHIADPEATLAAVTKLLAPRGQCIIRVPIVPSYAWDHYGNNWMQLDAPRHFYIHSVRSLGVLADRAGLELKEIIYDSSALQFWASEQYARNIPHYDPRSYLVSPKDSIFTERQIAVFARRAEELNRAQLGDQAAFYLRKRSVA